MIKKWTRKIWKRIKQTKKYKNIRKKAIVTYILTARALISIGEQMLHRKVKYRIIRHILENSFETQDIEIKVVKVTKNRLFVRFHLEFFSTSLSVNWEYFLKYVSAALGCAISDIAMYPGLEARKCEVDITNTAIEYFEKGFTLYPPYEYEGDVDEDGNVEKIAN